MSVAAAAAEVPERKSWSAGMAPAYIGTFLWVAFFDGLGRRALPVGGLIPTLAGVLAAAVLAYLLLYRVPATWGFATRRPLDDLAGSSFGVAGSLLIPNLFIGLGQVGLFAIGIGYATEFLLEGLLTLGLIDARVLRAVIWRGTIIPAPLFLTTALVWGTVTALVGMTLVRWIAAIMQYFPVFPAIGLALVVAGNFTGLPSFRPTGIDPTTGGLAVANDLGPRLAFLAAFQWTFGFSALLGITGADWAAASLSPGDVRKGGWIGLAVAPVVVASLALLAVAGHEGKVRDRAEIASAAARNVAPSPYAPAARSVVEVLPDRAVTAERDSFRSAVRGGLDARLAGAILIVFGLASLAPACYAAHEFSRRFTRIAPRFSRAGWTLVGVGSGWFLILGGWSERTDILFSVLGGLFAPVAGVLVADSTRRGQAGWPGARRGVNPAGLLAWTLGAVVGLAPVIAREVGPAAVARVPVSALLAFLAAFVAYRLAAALGLEPRATATIPPP